jgi:hypothetical protein
MGREGLKSYVNLGIGVLLEVKKHISFHIFLENSILWYIWVRNSCPLIYIGVWKLYSFTNWSTKTVPIPIFEYQNRTYSYIWVPKPYVFLYLRTKTVPIPIFEYQNRTYSYIWEPKPYVFLYLSTKTVRIPIFEYENHTYSYIWVPKLIHIVYSYCWSIHMSE